MDSKHLPSVIGMCVHCHLPLYAGSPIAKDHRALTLSHVACAVDARREH